jgi:hypothetical protein
MDLVVIDCTLNDETYWVSPPMPRWIAENVLLGIGMYGQSPIEGKRVIRAILVPREEKVH